MIRQSDAWVAKQRGGREVYIAKNPAPGCSLAKIVGFANAQALYKLLGSGKMLVPAGNISGQTGRRQRIAMLLDQSRNPWAATRAPLSAPSASW